MENESHQEYLERIDREIRAIKQEMSEFEFIAKKEEVERKKEFDAMRKVADKDNEYIRSHLKHLSQLAGVTFDELETIDLRLETASASLSRKRKV